MTDPRIIPPPPNYPPAAGANRPTIEAHVIVATAYVVAIRSR
ncbi:hypothetical protein [Streptomyces sp. H27-C3]|nr:hypothetical protein [Streptomyces sp. H27-C3]MDJ0461574.1 hypothetical protein [Streptomyces sp. H27-C3]